MTRLICHSNDLPSEEGRGQLEGKSSEGLRGQKYCPGSRLEALETPHGESLPPLGVKNREGVVAGGTKGIDQQPELHHPFSLFISLYCCSFSCV